MLEIWGRKDIAQGLAGAATAILLQESSSQYRQGALDLLQSLCVLWGISWHVMEKALQEQKAISDYRRILEAIGMRGPPPDDPDRWIEWAQGICRRAIEGPPIPIQPPD